MSCLSAKNKNKASAKQPPQANGSTDDPSPPLEKPVAMRRRQTFYGKIDDEIVPVKVDFMRMVSSTDDREVNRFVILTDSLLMIYDEDAQDTVFQKKIVHLQTADITPGDCKLVIEEKSAAIKATMMFRDQDHMSEWRRALNKVKTDLKIPAQNKDDSFEGLDELDDGEMEGSRNITSAMAYKSKAAVEHETNIREHQTAVTKALQKRVEQGDVACAKAVLDIQAAYLKKGVFNSGRANEVLFKKQENLLNVESVPVEAPQVVEEQKVPEVEEVKVVEAEEPQTVAQVPSPCRDTLPFQKDPEDRPSVWKVLKEAVGKDLGKFCVPVYFNEPVSMVQKVSEIMEYQDLLQKADLEDDPVRRLALVAAFGVAQYKATDNRLNKPFNPILGETFELIGEDWTYFAEQVTHHPPVSACIGESAHYKYHMDTNTKMSISIRGRLDAIPIGYQHVQLKTRDEHYVIGRPPTCVQNLLFGKMYLEHIGTMMVKNCATGHQVDVEFKASGWTGSDKHVVEGNIVSKDKKTQAKIVGKWSEGIKLVRQGQEEAIWTPNPMPAKHDWQYFFTKFAMGLNAIDDDLKAKLPISDSRLRPDQRALEEGNFELAASEKHRLEEKQRAARKWRAENPGNDFAPKYFKQVVDPDTNEPYFAYGELRDYWADRAKGDFAHMEDLF